MFCPECGYQNNDNNKYCMKCGKDFSNDEKSSSANKATASTKFKFSDLLPKNSKHMASAILSISGVLIIIVGCFMPLVSVLNLLDVRLFDSDPNKNTVIFACLLISALILNIFRLQKLSLLPAGLFLCIIIHNVISIFNDDNQFNNIIKLYYGFYIIISGALITVTGCIIASCYKWDKTNKLVSRLITIIKNHKICTMVICLVLAAGTVMGILTFKYKVFCRHEWQSATCDSPEVCSKCGRTQGVKLEHNWVPADCENPETCSLCSETRAPALGHKWLEATCEEPETCKTCHKTEGKSNGHDWEDATCETPKTCKICKKTEGKAKGHKWTKATCTKPKTCQNCDKTEGKSTGHKWVDATLYSPETCSVCGETEGYALNYEYIAAGKVNVDSGGLNLRKEMNTSSEVITLIPDDTTISLYDCYSSEWYYTEYNGKYGYVSSDFISFDTPYNQQTPSYSDDYRTVDEVLKDDFSKIAEDTFWNIISGKYEDD